MIFIALIACRILFKPCLPQKIRETGKRREKLYLYSELFNPITVARRQVTMNRIACACEGIELVINVNMGGRAVVLLIKTMGTGTGEVGV